MAYNLFVTYQTGEVFELPYLNLDFTDQLNVGKNARFKFSYKDVEKVADAYNTTVMFILTAGIRKISVLKDSSVIYLGVITDYILGKDDKGLLTIDVASVGLSTLIKKRRTGSLRNFTATDAGQIAWTLINESQLSDVPYSNLGITAGSITASVNRTKQYRFAEVLDSIYKMSADNLYDGFDFEIDNLSRFNVYYPKKGTNRVNIFIDKGNIKSWKFQKPLILNLTNKVYVLGQGFDDALQWVLRTSAVPYRQAFGTLEATVNERESFTTADLNSAGDKYLSLNQSPLLDFQIQHKDDDPDILTYDVGDSLRVTLDEVSITNEYKRVMARQITIDTQGQGIVTLKFE
jgi:hypothetical protein